MDLVDVEYKRNDRPILQRQLQEFDGTPSDLTDATAVVFNLSTKEAHVAKVARGVCAVVDPTDGQVTYQFQSGDLDTAGFYEGEFEVTYNDDSVRTFPSRDYLQVLITADLG